MEKREKLNIFLSVSGMSVSRLGSLIYTFAIGLYVLKMTGSGQTFGATLMLGILPRVLLGPFVGNLADRMDKKILIVGSDLVSGIIMGILFFYALSSELTIPVIYGATLLLSISSVFLDNAFIAAQRDIVRLESLTRLGSLRQSLESLINLFSPIIGGMIYALVPISAFLLINGISFLISAFSEVFIDFNFNKLKRDDTVKNSFFEDFKNGLVYVKKEKLIMAIGVSALLINFFLSSMSVVLPFAMVEVFQFDEKLYGLVTSLMSLGALAGAVIIGKSNARMTRKLLIGMMFLMAAIFLSLGISTHPLTGGSYLTLTLIGVFGFIITGCATMLNIPLGVFMQTYVDPAYLGRVGSLLGTLATAIMPISIMLFGILTDYLHPFVILTINGTALFIVVIGMSLSPVLHKLNSVQYHNAEEQPA